MLQNLFLNESAVVLFVMIFLRVNSFILSSSIFNASQIPAPVKILLGLCITLLLYYNYSHLNFKIDGGIIFLAAKEVFIGVCLGLLTRFFFHAISMGSELISTSLGLNSASVFNPMSGINSNLIEQFQALLAILVFFSLQGHHLLVGGIIQSFELIPLNFSHLKMAGLSEFVVWSKNLFEIALKISAPVVSSIFLVNLSMGILGRAVPQINVFVTSFQVTILVGFLILIISMPLFLGEMIQILDLTQTQLFKFMRTF